MDSCHLSLISSASAMFMLFLSFIVPILHEMSLGISNFLEEISSFPFYCFPLFLCIDHWGRLSCLSLLFFWILHSDWYIFPFLLCLSLLFTQPFVRPPQTTICLFAFLFLGDCFAHHLLCSVTNLCPWVFWHSVCQILSPESMSLPLYTCKGFDLGHSWVT